MKKIFLRTSILIYLTASVLAFFVSYKYFFTKTTPEVMVATVAVDTITKGVEAEALPGEYRTIAPLFSNTKKSFIESKKDFLEADLGKMVLIQYKNGKEEQRFPIKIKGQQGSWGETVSGVFDVHTKEEVHLSSLGQVYMPWNMVFQGNYSIHGLPYTKEGLTLPNSFSSGCINLAVDDAEALYRATTKNTPVIVHETDFENDEFVYPYPLETPTLPDVTATAYLVADLKNGTILLEKNATSAFPLASVTKLMTALIASEFNLLSFKEHMTSQITITSPMTEPYGDLSSLSLGQTYSYFELLYPLLMPSSNDAAEALAMHQGQENFITLMNKRAKSLEMEDTSFNDAYGIDPQNTSSAQDLYKLARYIYNNRPWIYEITKGHVYTDFGAVSFQNLKNYNLFMNDPAFIGGKVGSTPEAWRTGVFLFNVPIGTTTRPIVFITLHSSGNQADINALRAWIHQYISLTESPLLEDTLSPELLNDGI